MKEHYQFDAYQAYHALQERYADFLLDVFGVRPGPLANVLRSHWSSDSGFSLFAPLLVQAAFPFRPGKMLAELQAPSIQQRTTERPLHPKTVALLKKGGIDYKLFEHQVDTIRAASRGETVVLSAGTGSGKTEAFVIPLIDRLFWDHEEGRDDLSQPGVRALVIYPLNALVNNQVDRLLAMLGAQDEINFAYYTSRLKDTWRSAKNSYERRGKPVPQKCQIIDRATLRGLDGGDERPEGPPHILVTNFSMLEYMLIRPSDRTIFEPEHLFYGEHPRLKMMVLDEAHVYAGAQAAEIHMLLRRAAQRFGTTLEAVQGFATSATLAQGENEGRAVLEEYASRMFAKKGGVKSVEGLRHLPDDAGPPRQVRQLRDPATLLADQQVIAATLRTLKYDNAGNPFELLRDASLADAAWKACEALGLVTEAERARLPEEIADCPALLLHHVYATHPRLTELRVWLFEQKELPDIDQVAAKVYGPAEPSEPRRRATDAILRLGSLARLGARRHPFIPIRMHALVRAPAGVWVDPRPPEAKADEGWPWGPVTSLAPSGDPAESPRAQLGVCAECGAPYLVAHRVGKAKELRIEKADKAVRLAVRPKEDSEDVLCVGEARIPVEVAELGAADRHGRSPMACLQCNTVATRLRPLLLSPRAALGAVVDMVYPHLGEMPPGSAGQEFRPGGGRRLLTFSDSRQEAARIAAVVESTHDTGVNRQLIVKVLRNEGGEAKVKELARALGQDDLIRERAASRGLKHAEALEYLGLLSIHEELARPPSRANTLETLGIVEVVYPNLPPCPSAVLPYFGSDKVWKDFVAQLLDFARSRGVVLKPGADDPEAEEKLGHFLPNTIGNKLVWTKEEEPPDEDDSETDDEDAGRDVPMYPSRRPETGRMYEYTKRVRERLEMSGSMGVDFLLSHAWDALSQHAKQGCKWLLLKQDKLQIDLSRLELRLHEQPPFVDADSGRVYFRSVGGVVPARDCPRTLAPMNDDARASWAARHSVRRILEDPLLGLHSVEHTAQIGVDSLEGEENAFRRGERNLLASSTTLEMGVDIGGLTFVMLTNVPPGPANYWQRAGRAGRRADGSSMVLTLALNRPHDQLVFTSPRRFLHSEVTPPRVRLDAAPLLLRHVNASLLAAFFEEAVERDGAGSPMRAFGTVDEFLFQSAIGGGGMDKQLADTLGLRGEDPLAHAFECWLGRIGDDSSVASRIRALTQGTTLATYSITELAASCSREFARAVEAVRGDYDVLKEQQEREMRKGESARDTTFLAALAHQERVLLVETLIACLARSGFLPRFGFPLDVVHLDTKWKFRKKKDKGEQSDDEDEPKPREEPLELRMERALDIALSEYAPGSEIIAGKQLHRVAGVVRNWLAGEETSVVQHFYLECEKCGHFADRNMPPKACELCGHPTVFGEELESASETAGRRRRKKKPPEEETPLEAGEVFPSRVRRYMRPSGFAVKAGRRPRRVGSEVDRMPSPRVTVCAANSIGLVEILPAGVIGGFTANSTVFVRSEGRSDRPGGPGFGFAICWHCGFAEPEESFDGPYPEAFVKHDRLRGFRPCEGQGAWRHAVLGTSMIVDAFRLRLTKEFRPAVRQDEQEAFFHTLAAYLQLVAARRLQVDPRTLHAAVATWQGATPGNGHESRSEREAVVYETNGSGMLRHLMDDPVALLREVVAMLETDNEGKIIRFDTQFLAARGMLRVDLLRAHFLDPAREMLLDAANPLEKHGAVALRGRGPMLAAIELVEDTSAELGLQAAEIAGDALEAGGLLCAVQRRVLAPGKHVPRLLLSRLPDASGKNDKDAVVAMHLRRLIESGVHIRIAAAADRKALGEDVWQVLSNGPARAAAIGGVQTTGGDDPRFGSAWLDGCASIEAKPEAAKEAWSRFAERWGRGQPVTVDDLTPKSPNARPLVEVAKGMSNPDLVHAWRLLRSRLGDLNQLGRVTRLAYNDRHLGKSAIAMWMLGELLQRFTYAPDAKGKIWTREAEGYDGSAKTSDELFKLKKAPGNLGPKQSEMLAKWCSVEAGRKGLGLCFERRFELEHPRKLVIEFAPGGKHSSLKVLFDSGLDWAECKSVVGPWTQGPFQTRTTHMSIYVDLPVGDDLAALGV